MTIKEIWENFKKSVVDCFDSSVNEVKSVAKSSFDLLKTTLVDFVKGVFNWLVTLLKGVCVIAYNLIKVVCVALWSAIEATLGIVLTKIIEWIEKL